MADNLGFKVGVDFDLKNADSNLKKLLKQLEQNNKLKLITDVDTFKKLETQFNKLKESQSGFKNEQQKFIATQNQSEVAISQINNAINSHTKTTNQNTTAIKHNTHGNVGWAESMKNAMIKSVQWGASMAILYGSLRRLREGITFIKEMDDSLTQITMVTGKTIEETRRLAHEYKNLGVELKTSIKDLTTSAVSLFRQGLDTSEVEERLTVIAKTARATAVDIGLTTDFITAGVNASKMAAEAYSDTLIKASSISGTSFAELGEGMSKVVSAASISGISVQKLTSYISTLSETTRESASSLGNSMKTVIARFNSINEEGEINEDFNKVQTAIESVGIAFVGLDNQIRPVSDILDDLNVKWSSLDKNTQQYLSTQIAGVRQISRFQALMENYNRSLEINNELMDASGTLNEQYSKYLNSAEAAAQNAKVAFEQMWMNAMNSDAIKTFYNITASITNTIDKIGLLKTAVFTLSTVMLLGSKSFQSWASSMGAVKITAFTSGLYESINAIKVGNASFIGMGVVTDALRIKTLALQAAWTFGLSIAITSIVSGLTKLIGSVQEAKRAKEELLQSTVNNIQSYESEIKQLENLKNKHENLIRQKEQGRNVDEELLAVQREIASLSPELVTGLDSEGKAIAENVILTDRLIQKKKELLIQEMEVLQFQAKTKLPQIKKDYADLQAELDDINKALANGGRITWNIDGVDVLVDATEDLNARKLQILETQGKLIEEENKWLNILKKVVDQEQIQILASSKSEEQKQNAIKALKEFGLAQEDINDLVDYFIAKQKQSNESGGVVSVSDIKILKEYTDSFSNITSSIQDYYKLLNELNSSESLSATSKQAIIEKHQQLLPYINDEKELRNQLIKIINQEEESQRSAYFNMIKYTEEFLNVKVDGNKKLVDKLAEFYNADLTNAKNLAQAKSIVEETLISSLSKQWGRYMDVRTGAYTADYIMMETLAQMGDQNALNTLKAFDSAIRETKKLSGDFEKITLDLISPDFKSINLGDSKSKSPTKDYLAKEFLALTAYEERIKDFLNNLKPLQQEIKSLEFGIQEAEILGNTQKELELRQQLIQKRKEEEQIIKSIQGEIIAIKNLVSDELQSSFAIDISNLNSEQLAQKLEELYILPIDKLKEKIRKANDDMGKASSSSAKQAIQNTISTLERELQAIENQQTIANHLIKVFQTSESEIEKLGADAVQAYINGIKSSESLMRSIIETEKKILELDLQNREKQSNIDLAKIKSRIDSEIATIESDVEGLQSKINSIEESERLRSENLERAKKLTEISELQNKLYHLQSTEIATMSAERAKQLGIEKEVEEYQQRQLKLQELQMKLENLKNQKTIQQLQKMEDGTFDYAYVADQDAIDKTLKDIEDTQKDHDKWITDNIDKTNDDLKKKREDYWEWERSNTIRNQIEDLRNQIQHGQNKIKALQEDYRKEKEARDAKFATEREDLKNQFLDIETKTSEHLLALQTEYQSKWDEIQSHLEIKFNKIKSDYLAMLAVLSTPISTGAGGVNMTTVSAPKTVMSSIQTKHDGGFVGDGSRDLPEIVNRMFNAKPNEQIVKALRGELFIPEENIMKNFIPNMKNLANSMVIPVGNGGGDTQQHFHISKLEFPNVRDAGEVIDTLQHLSTYVTQKIKK